MPRKTRALAIFAVLALGLAGCFSESDENTNEGADAPGEQVAVEVRLTDESIEMPDEVPAGDVVFEVSNSGTEPHGFKIEGVDGGFDELRTDQLDTFQAQLEPGEYTVYSPVEGDRDAGLERSMTVVAGEDDGNAPLNDEAIGPSEQQEPIEDEGS